MNGYPQKRAPRRRQPETEAERIQALRDLAVKLHDKGDGHGADWAEVAATAFKVAFSCLDELPAGHADGLKVARRVHDGAYNRIAGTSDSGTAYTTAKPERPPFAPGNGPSPDLDLHR